MNNSCIDNKSERVEDYLKLVASVIVITLALVIISYIIIFVFSGGLSLKLSKCEKLTDIILAFLAIMTFVLTCLGYYFHRQRDRAEVLSKYNERYSKDEHVNKVVPFLIADIMGTKVVAPSIYNMEMFMRFFEEMELQIEKRRLDADSVYKLFSYYALYLDSKPNLIMRLSIDDYREDNWELFLNFVDRMAKINFKDSIWCCGNKKISFDSEYLIINGKQSTYTYFS